VCVPEISQWRYGGEGDSIPWYQSLRVIRQHKGAWNLAEIAAELNANFRTVPAAARNAA
jgi:hypothetical protein